MLPPGRVILTLWKCCWKRVSGKPCLTAGLRCVLSKLWQKFCMIFFFFVSFYHLLQTPGRTSGTMRTSWLWTWRPTRAVPRFSKECKQAVSTTRTRGQDCITHKKMVWLYIYDWAEMKISILLDRFLVLFRGNYCHNKFKCLLNMLNRKIKNWSSLINKTN